MFQFAELSFLGVSPYGLPIVFFSPIGLSSFFRPCSYTLVFLRNISFTLILFNLFGILTRIGFALRIRRLELLSSTWKEDSLPDNLYALCPPARSRTGTMFQLSQDHALTHFPEMMSNLYK